MNSGIVISTLPLIFLFFYLFLRAIHEEMQYDYRDSGLKKIIFFCCGIWTMLYCLQIDTLRVIYADIYYLEVLPLLLCRVTTLFINV